MSKDFLVFVAIKFKSIFAPYDLIFFFNKIVKKVQQQLAVQKRMVCVYQGLNVVFTIGSRQMFENLLLA